MNQPPSPGHPHETPPSSTGPRPPSLTQRAGRITRAVPQVVACRQTAAHIWGLQVLPAPEADWPVELTAPRHLVIPGCVTYLASLPDEDITEHNGVRITTMERTALDCARCLPRMEAVAIVDQFARKGVNLEALWHRPLNSWRLRDTLSLADRGAASPRESWLRVLLVDGGLPRPTTQIRVALAEDRFAYLDMGWEEFKVAVEYDGRQHHTSAADQQRDTDRREELRRRGWRVIAVRRDVIPGQIADLLHHVADALIERGWRPGPHGTNRILSRIRAARRSSRFRLPTHPTPGHATFQPTNPQPHHRAPMTTAPTPISTEHRQGGQQDDTDPVCSPASSTSGTWLVSGKTGAGPASSMTSAASASDTTVWFPHPLCPVRGPRPVQRCGNRARYDRCAARAEHDRCDPTSGMTSTMPATGAGAGALGTSGITGAMPAPNATDATPASGRRVRSPRPSSNRGVRRSASPCCRVAVTIS